VPIIVVTKGGEPEHPAWYQERTERRIPVLLASPVE